GARARRPGGAVRLTLRGAVPPGHRWWGAGVRQTDPDGPGAGAAGEQRADRGRGGPGSRIYRSVLLLPAVPRRLRGEPLAVPRRLPRRAGAVDALTGGLRRASPRSAQLGERLGDL